MSGSGSGTALVEPLLCLALAARIHGTDKAVRRTATRAYKRHPAQTWLLAFSTAPKALALVRQTLAALD
ncbi:hypothetical protein D9M69_532200 [compost metagenome]